jgi:phage terminase large subunit
MPEIAGVLPNGWAPREYQKPAWRYLWNGGRLAELIWHRRSGKDELALHMGACKAMQRPANYWHMLPEAAQARKAIWLAVNPHTGQRRIDEAFPRWMRRKVSEQEMRIEMINGSSWQVVGSDNFNSLVGAAPAGIVYSEWALANPAARAYLRPILLENGGWQVFISTPRGRNHAFTTFNAATRNPDAFAQRLSVSDTKIFSAQMLADELQAYINDFGPDLGHAMFDQEYMVSFDAANLGAVLGRWMSRARAEGRLLPEGVFDPNGGPVYVSSDLGFRDTASWWFWQPRQDGFGLVGYLGASRMDADDWIDELTEYLTKRGMRLGKIWLPHDARNKTFATKHSPMERFLMAFGKDKIRVVPQTKISDRINAARRLVEKCYFDETACADGVSGLESWHFEYDTETKTMSREPFHDWASHPGDAFSYGCQMMELEPPPKEDAPKPRFLHQMTANELFWPTTSGRIQESDGFQ